jgi:hypothetical protein
MAQYQVAGEFVDGQNITRTGPVLQVDTLGELQGIEIHGEGVHELLTGEPVEKLREIATKIATRPELRSVCSVRYVERHLAGWVERARLAPEKVLPLTEDLLEALGRDVKPVTVLVPLDGLHIARAFQLGKVYLDYFTSADIDRMVGSNKDGDVAARYRERLTREYLGRVYAIYECEAEEGLAQALAFEECEQALNVLRFLDDASHDVRARCFIGRYGQVSPGRRNVFFERHGGAGPQLSQATERTLATREMLDAEFFEEMAKPLAAANRILASDARTQLEEDAINAVSLFARGVVSPAPQDRILHALTAVESLLLLGETDPIVHRLGLRMAFINGRSLEERRTLIEDLSVGYRLRSRFVHHGLTPTEIPAMNRLVQACWRTVFLVLLATDSYKTREEMIQALDDRVLA